MVDRPRSRTSPPASASRPRRSRWCCATRPGRARRPAGACWPPPRSWATAPDRTASLLARRRRHLLGVHARRAQPVPRRAGRGVHEQAERLGYDVVLSTLTAGPRRAARGRDAARLPLRGADPARPGCRPAPAGGAGPAGAGRRGGPAGPRARRQRGAGGRRRAASGWPSTTWSPWATRAIAYVDGGRGAIAADRRRGYRAAMRRPACRGPPCSPAAIPRRPGSAAAAELLAEPRLPTAVVAFNDRCGARPAGRVRPRRRSTCRTRSRWSATTTARWPGSPTST